MERGRPDTGWAWMIVIGVTIINLSVLPVQQCFGLIFGERFRNLNITATQTSLILHLNGTIMCSLGLISGPMMKRFSFRKVALFGGLTVAIGIWITAFAISLPTIILSYCIVVGIGQGIIFPATNLALNTYFRKKRKIAMGFSVTLTGLGPIVMPLLLAKLLDVYSTTGTLIILAAMATNSLVGASLLRPYRKGKKIGVEHFAEPTSSNDGTSSGVVQQFQFEAIDAIDPDRDTENGIAECQLLTNEEFPAQQTNNKPENATKAGTQDVYEECHKDTLLGKIFKDLDLDLLRDTRYVALVIGMGVSLVAETNFNAMIPFVLTELAKMERSTIANVLSIQAASDITGRLCVPLLAQKVGWTTRNLYILSLLGSIIGRTILSKWSDYYTVVVVSIIVGLAKGTKAVFQALLIPDYVPLERLPAAYGIQMVCNGILSITMGPIIGMVHDFTDSYVGALHFTSTLSASCVFLWIVGGLWTPLAYCNKFCYRTQQPASQERPY